MAQFITTTFASGNDIALQLGNEEWVRTLAIGSTWTHIRIGMLYQITGTATISSATTQIALGMCSGDTAPFNNASTTNFVGLQWTGALAFVTNGTLPYYQFQSTNGFMCKKVGGTITQSATNVFNGSDMGCNTTLGSPLRRSVMYLDIVKGSPTYSLTASAAPNMSAASGGNNASHDFTVADLISGMTQTLGSLVVGGVTLSNGNGTQTITTSESLGGFDTVDVYANMLNNPFNLYEVAVEKLA